jgi:copper chaperone CopZ
MGFQPERIRRMPSRRCFLTSLALLVLAVPSVGQGANQEGELTLIQVKSMHCAMCAKKITQKLQAVDGVRTVKADPKKDTALVAPAKSKTLSPRALWEAVEAAGFQPVKLAGPAGVYTAKPGK